MKEDDKQSPMAQSRSVLYFHGCIHTVINSPTASLNLRDDRYIPQVLLHVDTQGSLRSDVNGLHSITSSMTKSIA